MGFLPMPQINANVSNNQDTTINIGELYTNIIQEIDRYRSHISIINKSELINQLIKALNGVIQNNTKTNPDSFISQIKPDTNAQESRCHTFYRLIGLPIISPDGSLYSPGFDKDNSFKMEVASKHYKIIENIKNNKPAIFKIMDAREKNVNSFLRIFSFKDINSSVLGLSSVAGGRTRKFSDSLVNSIDPLDTEVKNQSYTIEDTDTVRNKLLSYVDVNGNSANLLFAPGELLGESLLTRRAHILKPFMVDPRVDFTVNPPTGIITAPFATSSQYSSEINLTRPFIEYVCRIRLDINNTDGIQSDRFKDIESYIKNTSSIKDQTLIDKISNGIIQTSEEEIFRNNFNIMRAMMDLLYDSMQKIKEAAKLYHWIPVPNSTGIETNITTQDITLIKGKDQGGNPAVIVDPLSTERDIAILTTTSKVQLSNVNTQNTTAPDIGNFAFQGVQPLPDGRVTSGIVSRTKECLDIMVQARTETTSNAAEALQNIEIIMGEFTGLGLGDIIAIYTALWTVDENVLINLLDDEAFGRLFSDPTLRTSNVIARNTKKAPTMSGTDALQGLENKIKEMYNLMDKLLEDRFLNNKA